MTITEMVEILVDKGFSKQYAETIAPYDLEDLNSGDVDQHPDYECSICRRTMSAIQWRYHYHPCE
jgi:hypothetical protein